MSKRRRKKSFRPKQVVEPAQMEDVMLSADGEHDDRVDVTAEPVTVSADEPEASEPNLPAARSDSLEPVAFLAEERSRLAGDVDAGDVEDEMILPRPRSRFRPMVKTIVAACGAIALIGGLRTTVAHSRSNHANDTRAAAGSPPAPPNRADDNDVPAPRDGKVSAEAMDETDPALAKTLSERSQMKLEKGLVDDSIELGEQAVLHDAANARAWVVLGAAYQQKRDMTNARRCYRMCVKGVAPAGDKSRDDCAAMLQK